MKKKKVDTRSLILLAVSVALFIFGVCSGESQRVLEQAVSICLECIGIG